MYGIHMTIEFEWDFNKAANNERKHGVSFEEASTCFYDQCQVAFYDPEHSEDEDREILFGQSERQRLLVVSYTLRNEVIRIISARPATRREVKEYEEGI